MNKFLPAILCSALVGCVAPQVTAQRSGAAQESEKYVATFSYTPAAQAAVRTEVTLTIGRTNYNVNPGSIWFTSPQFAGFDSAIQKDLQVILGARGLGVRGPFDSYDLIPYQDKKAIDLLLVPVVETVIVLKNHQEKAENMWVTSPDTHQTGNAEITGNITLQLKEITTRELMWAKTIPIRKIEFPYFVVAPNGQHKPGVLFSLDVIYNGMAREMEQQYPDLMATIFSLVDPEEMTIIREQAQELKSRKAK